MRYLVTGGCGFIGGHIVDQLVENGHEVIVIDNLSSDSSEGFHFNKSENVSYHNIDIRDFEKILPLFTDVECVFHLAAESKIQPILNNPRLAVDVNVMGTCNVLESSRINGVKRLIYSSTSAIYGLKNNSPLTESMEEDCLNSYSVSKKSGEDLCKLYYKTWGLETIIFRYFNVYGDRHSSNGQYAPVIGKFLRQYKEGLPLTVVGDGTQKRDFIFVKDVVRANILASQSNNKEILGEILNVGYGKNYSVIDIAKMIGENIEFINQRPGECLETLADISKIKSLLGWEPTTKLEDWLNSQK
jgi:UDP-glucose 4-epimerase